MGEIEMLNQEHSDRVALIEKEHEAKIKKLDKYYKNKFHEFKKGTNVSRKRNPKGYADLMRSIERKSTLTEEADDPWHLRFSLCDNESQYLWNCSESNRR